MLVYKKGISSSNDDDYSGAAGFLTLCEEQIKSMVNKNTWTSLVIEEYSHINGEQ
jgi:hypothetical protein